MIKICMLVRADVFYGSHILNEIELFECWIGSISFELNQLRKRLFLPFHLLLTNFLHLLQKQLNFITFIIEFSLFKGYFNF
jgi:hypothetical protein